MVEAMTSNVDHTYVTLTKNPSNLAVVLHAMPSCHNEYHGLTVRNQDDADRKLAGFLTLRGHTWLSVEPLLGPVDLQLKKWCIEGVIVGHDNRRGAPGTDTLDHVRSVVKQCRAAGVRVFVKQLWINRHLSKESLSCFPPDLRLRNLPWSMPEAGK